LGMEMDIPARLIQSKFKKDQGRMRLSLHEILKKARFERLNLNKSINSPIKDADYLRRQSQPTYQGKMLARYKSDTNCVTT
jgi:hypothetical protein